MSKLVALVTGSNRGIGKSCIEEFARAGVNVVINYCHHEDEAKELEKQIKEKYSVEVLTIKCDISKEEEVENMINTIVDTFGGIDILVNNASVSRDSLLLDKNIKEFKRIIDVNQGYARCSVAVIDKNSVITADEAIARKLSGEGFDVLRIRPGCIELPGYDYGFIGGCCGKLSSDKILFCGNPLNHPDGRLITEFIKSKDIEIITTDESNLFDFGGIVQIFW